MMKVLIMAAAAGLLFGCGFKKEDRPKEQDTARYKTQDKDPADEKGGVGAAAKAGGVKANLDNVMDEVKKDRDKKTREIFDQ